MKQVKEMSVADKMRLMEYLVKSIFSTVMQYDYAAKVQPRAGYGTRFHKLHTTEKWMKELREGEEE